MSERFRRAGDLLELAGLMRTSLYGVSVEFIADHFEVSRRTAERMLAAIRLRTLDLEYEVREGHKYWRLPSSSSFFSIELPEEIEALSRRIAELEAEVLEKEKQSESRRTLLDAALGRSPVGIFILDADFQVIWVNESLLEYFGLERHSIVGRDKRTLIRQGIREIFEESAEFESRVLATYDNNSYIENFQCHVLPRHHREERWLEHWSQPILDGPYSGGRVEHYVDITQQMTDQVRNLRKRPALPARAGHLQQHTKARELSGAAVQIIRGPLGAVADFARQAISSGEDPSDAMKQVVQLTARVDEALTNTLGALIHSEPRPQLTTVDTLISGLVGPLCPQLIEKGHEIELRISPEAKDLELWIDPELVRWALHEFISNAMHAMTEAGKVTLMAEVVDSGSHVWLAVKDTGPGVADDVRDFIFNPFFTTRELAAGVGLSKALQVARDHGGEIGIEDNEGAGATVYLELPLGAKDSSEPAPSAEGSSASVD